ncbi:zinc-ribbon domain containing protein [Comamonas piscis]|uniref:Zinc-ribbon domain containing protein n=1 Tax=Comamonas piscis TaxID=1562974 RepID=A0A7G5EBM2_9BURK|nr:zinc-ribbon domain containing protein [Comamonas piscis]QMV71397.1 zinc-ribbon domain containing protein [Comamonas piscis]WSO34105.1 zinc-ribbon domain containing protein [Comamonas piscis]
MKKKKLSQSADYVPHPRYGSEPIPSDVKGVSTETILRSHWSYRSSDIFPESVLMADTSKQHFNVFPRECYVDMRKTCRNCQRPFIFFAAEQKHWFEVLQFYVDADCVHCPECRVQRTAAKRAFQRYSSLILLANPTQDELQQLVDAAALLHAQGTLKSRERLGQLKNAALRLIPDYPGTLALVEALRNQDAFPATEEGD